MKTGASVRPEVVGQVVVGVLVGDQHRVGAVEGPDVGEHPRVEHHGRAVVLDPDAGMAELRDPHAPTVITWRAATRPGENRAVLEVVVSGLVTGWAIAIPIGAVGAFLVTLTARTSLRVGAAGALGIATVDGAYASLAVVAGAALSALLSPVATPLRIASGAVLLVIAALTAGHALATGGRVREAPPLRPAGAYAVFVGDHRGQPDHVVYFAAVVLGNRHLVSTPAQGRSS